VQSAWVPLLSCKGAALYPTCLELELGAVLTLAGCSVPLHHPLLIHSGSLVFPLLAFTVRGASFEEQSDGHHSVVPSGGCWLLLSFVVRHILLFCD